MTIKEKFSEWLYRILASGNSFSRRMGQMYDDVWRIKISTDRFMRFNTHTIKITEELTRVLVEKQQRMEDRIKKLERGK